MNQSDTASSNLYSTQVYCIGSINIDHMYRCERIVGSGESIPTISYDCTIGGKGLNQAFAIFKAGLSNVRFNGIIGGDGLWMVDYLSQQGFPTDNILTLPNEKSGHTIIQVQEHNNGENAVLLHYGANWCFTKEHIREILKDAQPGDFLIVQCETNLIDFAMQFASHEKKMTVVFNAAPYPPNIKTSWNSQFPTDWLIINSGEAQSILQNICKIGGRCESGSIDALKYILEATKVKNIILTLGPKGCHALVRDGEKGHKYYRIPAVKVKPIDTTGAGDVFLGYFLTSLICGKDHFKHPKSSGIDDIEFALRVGSHAAAMAVLRAGALKSVPELKDVIEFMGHSTGA